MSIISCYGYKYNLLCLIFVSWCALPTTYQ
nr:MAG TPA: hypothetical protein [Caudoviricetes sp.]